MVGASGGSAYLKYIYESTFKAGGTAVRGLGASVKKTSHERKNNLIKCYGLGSQEAQMIMEGKFEGRIGLEWGVTNLWFLPAILGGSMGTPTGSGPYVYTPALANSLPSFSIENGLELGATDYVPQLLGCIMENLSLSMEIGDSPITAQADILYADETSSTTSSYATAATDTESAGFTFAHGKLELPSGTAIAALDKAKLNIKRNPELVWGLGSRKATTHYAKKREYDLDVSALLQDNSFLEKFYQNTGSATTPGDKSTTEITSIVLGFSNDGWSTAVATSRRVLFTLTGCKIETYGDPMEVDNGVMVSLGIQARQIAVTVTNNTATKPTDVP